MLSSNIYYVNVSSPASNTSDMTSASNINNLPDSFANISAGDIVSVSIKNIEMTATNWGDIQSNLRIQSGSTSVLSSAVVSQRQSQYLDTIGGMTVQSSVTASCVFIYLPRYFTNGRLEFDIDVKVLRRVG